MTIPSIPPNLPSDQLTQAINTRMLIIAQALSVASGNPVITGPLNMAGFAIVQLANPVNPGDALNLQTGDGRYAKFGSTTASVTTSTTPSTPNSPDNSVTMNGLQVIY